MTYKAVERLFFSRIIAHCGWLKPKGNLLTNYWMYEADAASEITEDGRFIKFKILKSNQ